MRGVITPGILINSSCALYQPSCAEFRVYCFMENFYRGRYALRVGKRFIEARTLLGSLGRFENRTAIQALNIFRVGVLGDQSTPEMLASSGLDHREPSKV